MTNRDPTLGIVNLYDFDELILDPEKYYIAPTVWRSTYNPDIWYATLELVRKPIEEYGTHDRILKVEGQGANPSQALISAETHYREIRNA